jgi:hypothetical protein
VPTFAVPLWIICHVISLLQLRRTPDSKPNRLMAGPTAGSKKVLAPISADGAATQCASA